MLSRQGIPYWLLLGYDIFYAVNYSTYRLSFCFWDAIICVMKAKCRIANTYVIKTRYVLLVMLSYSILQLLFLFLEYSYLCHKGEIWK